MTASPIVRNISNVSIAAGMFTDVDENEAQVDLSSRCAYWYGLVLHELSELQVGVEPDIEFVVRTCGMTMPVTLCTLFRGSRKCDSWILSDWCT